MKPLKLTELMSAWLDNQTASGRSERTMEAYRERLAPFIRWCQLREVQYAQQVSQAILESYQRHLRNYRKVNGELLRNKGQLDRLHTIRQWFAWMLQQYHILYNPAALMVLPKEEKRLPIQVLSEEETRNILSAQPIDSPTGLRDRAIMETFWSSGIRRVELSRLTVSDINFGKGVLLVRQGKGNKDRVVPLGEVAIQWIDRYLKEARPKLALRKDSGHLFLTIRGEGISPISLTALMGKAIREQANIDKPGACHLLRHSMATQMLENGADTRYIQAILGHVKLETTQIYTQVAIGPLKDVHNRTHPGNQVKIKKPQQDNEEETDNPGGDGVGQ